MTDFTFRKLTSDEELVSNYDAFVKDIRDGYGDCLSEYTNDLSCRERIEERISDPEFAHLIPAVEQIDAVLKTLLIPTNKCIHGSFPKSNFWYWGYPSNSPEVYEDLLSLGMIAN